MGVTGIKTTSSGPETVGVGTNFLDNVYFAEHIVGVGSSIVRVFCKCYNLFLELIQLDLQLMPRWNL